MSIRSSTISGNKAAGRGGGIINAGTLTMNDSTLASIKQLFPISF